VLPAATETGAASVNPSSEPAPLEFRTTPSALATVPPLIVPPNVRFHTPALALKVIVEPVLFSVPVRLTIPPVRLNVPMPAVMKFPPSVSVPPATLIVPAELLQLPASIRNDPD